MAAPHKGYRPPHKGLPTNSGGTVAIGNKPVSQSQWLAGDLYRAMSGGQSPPAPPAPPATPPPPRVFAPDSAYNDEIARIQRASEQTIGELDSAERRVKYSYGFDDPTNPFARASESKREFLQRASGITNSLAARGQFFSGARARQLRENSREGDKSLAALRQEYEQALETLRNQRARLPLSVEAQKAQALQDALARFNASG